MNIENQLRKTVHDELAELEGVELGSEQYKVAVDGITKMADRVLAFENQESTKALAEAEYKLKQKEAAEEKKDRFIRNVISVVAIVVPAGLTVWGTCKSLRFEIDGTVTTSIGRGFVNLLLPRRK
jgi:hypothetical protein